MATIAKIVLGGSNSTDTQGNPYRSAISYRLSQSSPFDLVDVLDDWEVEIKQGSSIVVARTTKSFSLDKLRFVGTERIERFLDLLSFERHIQLELTQLADNYVVLHVCEEQQIIQLVGTSDLSLQFVASLTVRDMYGNVRPAPTIPPSVWIHALRYYRMSQTSRNIYEAYRNLWLGLEVLLSAVAPKKRSKHEKKWLQQVLREVASRVDLKPYVPASVTDIVNYLVEEHYEAMRCNLFHAKTNPADGIPFTPNPDKAALAYTQLIYIWRVVAQELFETRTRVSGVITYEGFKLMMDNALSSDLSMAYTDDQTPVTRGDTAISPRGNVIINFDEVKYCGEIRPGHVGINGSLVIANHKELPVLHRIGVTLSKALFCAGDVDGGLELHDVDRFESLQIIRLINKGAPRTLF